MRAIYRALTWTIGVLLLAGVWSSAQAQFAVGTWVPESGPLVGTMTLKAELCCGAGRRFSYFIKGNPAATMVIESPLDGSEVPVLVGGKKSGETMAIKRVDARHLVTIIKMDGKPFGTSRSELSADGNRVTVVNNAAGYAGQEPKTTTEVWVRQ
jgi:hypothetical protein